MVRKSVMNRKRNKVVEGIRRVKEDSKRLKGSSLPSKRTIRILSWLPRTSNVKEKSEVLRKLQGRRCVRYSKVEKTSRRAPITLVPLHRKPTITVVSFPYTLFQIFFTLICEFQLPCTLVTP